jgi:hypothetical protein
MRPRGGGRTYRVTITPGDVRRLLFDTAVDVLNGEITLTQAKMIVRDYSRITRELNQRAMLAVRAARLLRGPKPTGTSGE